MSQLKISRIAYKDLQIIHDYIAQDSAVSASKFIDRLYNRCTFLAR